MTATTGVILSQALIIVLLALCLRRQRNRSRARELEHLRVLRQLERLELIYLGKRPWVRGWL